MRPRFDLGSPRWLQFLRDHGIHPFEWPGGARLHWYREIGEVSWSNGSFSWTWSAGVQKS